MAVDTRDRDRNDVILMPRQYAIIKDMTKGNLSVNVGPIKVTLSDAERLMAPDPKNPSRLREVNQEEAILPYVDAGESDYVVLNNPSEDKSAELKPKASHEMVGLQFGRKVNIPGPVSFPLWPFQHVEVIQGHQLQMNQYLVVRVVNDAEALANWNKGVVKAVEGTEQTKGGIPRPTTLSIGQLIIVKGTEISFYIPPTGLEVVKDSSGNYVRDAVTLEQLEYCVLIDQSGEKRFEQGPKVVFPNSTEEFVVEDNSKKFKATELTPISGLHIKVTAPYKDGKDEYKEGDELFITGDKQPIYFPRKEHAIVKYGNKSKHYATAIPKGEGRYVMNRLTGEIRLVIGPKMLLPDPRTEVIIKRILSEKQVNLMYPGNNEALALNRQLAVDAGLKGTVDYLANDIDTDLAHLTEDYNDYVASASAGTMRRVSSKSKFVGDAMTRSDTYTPPRTITLNTKYEGAVQVCPWTGYAVLVVDKSGNRKVVVGPDTVLLEFDQELASMEFSTGKPKNTDKLFKTVYLRVLNNQVSDIIDVMTSDDIPVKIKTSYRVNFLPEYKDKWFDAENYVKLLCDHVRSMMRNVVKKVNVQELAGKHIDLVRDTVLGVKTDEKTPRPGLTFKENGAHIYDVEVLGLEIGDSNIAKQLLDAQRSTIQDSLQLTTQKRHLALSKEQEVISQQLEAIRAATEIQKIQLKKKVAEENADFTMSELERRTTEIKAQQVVESEKQKVNDINAAATLEREKAAANQELVELKANLELELKKIEEETKNLAERTKAVTPDLIAALQRFADMSLAEKMADSMAPMALLGGKSVAEVLSGLLAGTGLEKLATGVALGTAGPALLKSLGNGNGNGDRLTQKV